MGSAVYSYPQKAYVNRNIPKTKFYENANITKSIKDNFVGQIQQIVWAYKLSPETINLPADKNLQELQVFNIHLKTLTLDEKVLLSIDKAIPHPIIFQLFYENNMQVKIAYKRPHESDEKKWVLEQYFSSDWISLDEADVVKTALPIALNLNGLYEQIVKALVPIEATAGESIKGQTERLNQINQKQKEIAALQTKMRNEKQFNRKVEMNNQLKALQNQLAKLQA